MCLAPVMNGRGVPICVDARMIRRGGTGTTTYAHGLIAAAEAGGRPFFLLQADHEADGRTRKLLGALKTDHLLCERNAAPSKQAGQRQAGPGQGAPRELVGRDIFRRAHVHFTLRRRFMRLKPPQPFGIMHWTYPVPIRMDGWINIYTVHDLIPLLHAHLSPISRRRHHAIMCQLRLHADRIVTVSDAARSDIVSVLGVEQERVVNCGQALLVPKDIRRAPPLGLREGGYFVYCGVVEPRKNLHRLIEAHARSNVDAPLVVAGPDGWRARKINRMIDLAPNVLRAGYLDRGELLSLIRGARGLLFPSLAEGFGLPVAEAMLLGTPVLTSSSGALAEVAGDAALLVNPFDVGGMAAGIWQLACDDALAAGLSARGRIRAEHFLLPRFVARLTAVYDEALAAYSGGRHAAAGPMIGRNSV